MITRKETLIIKLTTEEKELLKAKAGNVPLSRYIREVLLPAKAVAPAKIAPAVGGNSSKTAFAEGYVAVPVEDSN